MKVGDTVIRIEDPARSLPVGTICIIKRIDRGNVVVEGYNGWYSTECFELYKPESDNVINFLP